MARKRKQTDIEDFTGPQNGHGKPGHNGAGTLTDDERRALTLYHKNQYAAADALVEKAKADRKSIGDLAKADLGAGALADIKDMAKMGDEKVAKAGIERALRLARWMGLPVGTQINMFDVPVDDRAFEEGKSAGMEGQVCDPPRHLPAVGHQRWIAGWHEGQGVLAGAFKKLQYDAPPAPPASDAAHTEPAAAE